MRDQIHSLAILLNQEENSPPSVLFMQKRLCFTRQCCKRLQNSIIGKGMEVLQHALVTPGTSTMYTDRRLFRFSISKYLVNCCILSIWRKKMFQVITLVLQLQDVCRKTDTCIWEHREIYPSRNTVEVTAIPGLAVEPAHSQTFPPQLR